MYHTSPLQIYAKCNIELGICPSVCVCVCVKMSAPVVKHTVLDGSSWTLVFSAKHPSKLQWSYPNRGAKYTWGEQIMQFLTSILLYLAISESRPNK